MQSLVGTGVRMEGGDWEFKTAIDCDTLESTGVDIADSDLRRLLKVGHHDQQEREAWSKLSEF